MLNNKQQTLLEKVLAEGKKINSLTRELDNKKATYTLLDNQIKALSDATSIAALNEKHDLVIVQKYVEEKLDSLRKEIQGLLDCGCKESEDREKSYGEEAFGDIPDELKGLLGALIASSMMRKR